MEWEEKSQLNVSRGNTLRCLADAWTVLRGGILRRPVFIRVQSAQLDGGVFGRPLTVQFVTLEGTSLCVNKESARNAPWEHTLHLLPLYQAVHVNPAIWDNTKNLREA